MTPKTLTAFLIGGIFSASIVLGILYSTGFFMLTVIAWIPVLIVIVHWYMERWED